jgi:hypothetical protein
MLLFPEAANSNILLHESDGVGRILNSSLTHERRNQFLLLDTMTILQKKKKTSAIS